MARLVLDLHDLRPIWSVPRWAIEEIAAAAPDRFEVVVVDALADGRGDGGGASTEALDAVATAEIYMGFGFPRPLFLAAEAGGGGLRWVHSASAGVGGSLYADMRESEVLLTNSAGIHAEPMADTILAAILYFARGLDLAVRGQAEQRWANDEFSAPDTPVHEIAGATVGVVGFGGIGQAVARRAKALGMQVLAFNRSGRSDGADVEVLAGEVGLERLLRESRYLVLALPRTADTEDFLDRGRLDTLRGDAVVINVGRGELLDEEALTDALRRGRIRGAALDVFRAEPLPSDSPLWALPNLLITPHVSATTDRFWRREVDLITENLARYERGDPLLNVVAKHAGY
ncbi:MAG TPA: D-2-hydroxyacid dehydrogenase [Longimicrobiaceae bacterium]|nr:D-2-hydroxyacid dehydrogenase [Longimicrobiaceae bacterium]